MEIKEIEEVKEASDEVRRRALTSLYWANSGHPGSSLSVADIVATLFFKEMNLENDRFILSKGHAVPALYAALSMRGDIAEVELETLRRAGSRLQGHPVAGTVPHIDVSTGSLGQGLSIGLGMAKGKKMKGQNGRVYVVLGDGELQEGQNWEAFMSAPKLGADNLVAIIDRNRFQNDGATEETMPLSPLEEKLSAFGWNVLSIDGNNVEELLEAYASVRNSERPSVIVANTVKGKGVRHIETDRAKHNGAIPPEEFMAAMKELGVTGYHIPELPRATAKISKNVPLVAVRDAFGDALVKAGKDYENIVVVDCDLGSATKANKFGKEFPDRFIQVGIAEQNGVGIAAGLAKEGYRPFITSFGAFLTQRAKDQIMNSVGYSNAGVVLVGSHAGLAIGKDGATQMGIDDINGMMGIPNLEIYSPSDGIETAQVVEYLAKTRNPAYLRTSRRPQPQIHSENYRFTPGKAEVVRESERADLMFVATGDMVYNALESAEELEKRGIGVDVINVSTIRPFDRETILNYARKRSGILTLEDHSVIGGLGSRVAEAVADEGISVKVFRHGIRGYGESGDPVDLYRKHKLDVEGIVETAEDFYRRL